MKWSRVWLDSGYWGGLQILAPLVTPRMTTDRNDGAQLSLLLLHPFASKFLLTFLIPPPRLLFGFAAYLSLEIALASPSWCISSRAEAAASLKKSAALRSRTSHQLLPHTWPTNLYTGCSPSSTGPQTHLVGKSQFFLECCHPYLSARSRLSVLLSPHIWNLFWSDQPLE